MLKCWKTLIVTYFFVICALNEIYMLLRMSSILWWYVLLMISSGLNTSTRNGKSPYPTKELINEIMADPRPMCIRSLAKRLVESFKLYAKYGTLSHICFQLLYYLIKHHYYMYWVNCAYFMNSRYKNKISLLFG